MTLTRWQGHRVNGHSRLWHGPHFEQKSRDVAVKHFNRWLSDCTFVRMLTTLLIDVTQNRRDLPFTHKPKPYLVGEGGGEARSEVICSVKAHKTFVTSFELKPLDCKQGWAATIWISLCLGTLLLSAMLYGRGRKVLTLCGGSDCSSSDSGVSAAGDTSLSSCPVLVLLALDRKRELKGREEEKGRRRYKVPYNHYLFSLFLGGLAADVLIFF